MPAKRSATAKSASKKASPERAKGTRGAGRASASGSARAGEQPAAKRTSAARGRQAGSGARAKKAPAVKPVLVGYDGSPEARHAAVWAARSAAPNGSIVLIHAVGPRRRWLPHELLRTGDERRQLGRALIDELLMNGDDALLDVKLEAHVVPGTPAKALIDAAERHGAREIVVGSHHRGRSGAIYGDIAGELVRSAPIPVVVVPLGGEPA